MRDEKAITEKKEKILDLARKMGIEEDAHDYIVDLINAGLELVELEKVQ